MAVEGGQILDVDVSQFQSINYSVYSALRRAIFDGDLQDGDRIVEAEVSRKLGISRAPIREALQSLRQAGLVEHEPRRGWYVIGLQPDDMWDIYLIRAAIEAIAARRVAEQMSAELTAQLQALIAQMAVAAEKDDPDALAAYDVQFHELIIQHGGSNQLQRIWRQLHPQDWTIMSVLRLPEVPLAEMAQRHRTVLDAITSGDPSWAEAVIRRHILELAQRVLGLPPEPSEKSKGNGETGHKEAT
ncbi:MAG: GntR family transcriptional regulator [Anaerolineae bacterium]|jgi:DNA-binding GntR family transcriptional regulator